MQTKIYLIGNSTVRQSSFKETLTICIKAPQGSFTEKIKLSQRICGLYLSHLEGQIYTENIVNLYSTKQNLATPASLQDQQYFCLALQLHGRVGQNKEDKSSVL